jgi:hypothetical protein
MMPAHEPRSGVDGVTESSEVNNFANDIALCLPKTLSGMTVGWSYGKGAVDGRVPDPAAGCYSVAIRPAVAT